MKLIMSVLIIFSSITAFGLPKESKNYDGKKIAIVTAAFINRHKTLGSFLDEFKDIRSPQEIKNLTTFLTKHSVALDGPMPKFKVKGNKIYIDKKNYILFDKRDSVNINGKVFKQSEEPLDVVVKDLYEQLSPKSAGVNFFIPEANAGLSGLAGPLAVIGSGALFGGAVNKFLLGGSFLKGAMWGGLVTGGIYLLKALFNKNNDSGQQYVGSCDGPNYRVPPGATYTPTQLGGTIGSDVSACQPSYFMPQGRGPQRMVLDRGPQWQQQPVGSFRQRTTLPDGQLHNIRVEP